MKRLLIFTVWALLIFSGISSSQDVDLIFSHEMHVTELGTSCTDCHAAAETSLLPTDNMLPDMETCYQCHDEDAACSMCHQDEDNAAPYPRIVNYVEKFPHAKHSDKKCSTCHEGVESSSNIMDSHLPGMTTCVNCHNDQEAVDYCYVCHDTDTDLKPVDHKLDWTKAHGIASQTQSEDCAMCHTENQCQDCHEGDNLDKTVHGFNFRYSHSISAKGNKEECMTCHEEQSFCVDCHRQEFVLPLNHSYVSWSNRIPGNGGQHARMAQLDLDSCTSCHNESLGEPICADCHQ